ncbi:MAG: hypothetical protein IPN34_07625 [Planctomycetes bacterium]|nr:hypothetical protein [Planctomycetota bacterium]
MLFRHLAQPLAAALLCAAPLTAQNFYGYDAQTAQIYNVDTTTNAASFLASITGAPAFGFSHFVAKKSGGWYAVAPGGFSGFSIYEIDGQTYAATLLWTPTGVRTTGGVGAALSPYGDKIFVAGFVGLSFRVQLDAIDLSTGLRTAFGDIPPGWGLAFDSLGNLYTSTQGATDPELVRIDLLNPLNSVTVGTMTGVDYNMGIDLSSDQGSGDLHVYSRNTTSLYRVDTSNANATLVSVLTGASALTSVKEIPCSSVYLYGNGCAGSGGFVPSFTVRGCAGIGETITLQVNNCLGGAAAAFVYGTGTTAIPLGAGCDLLTTPLLPVVLNFGTSAGGPGQGSASFPVLIPWMPTGDVTTQVIVIDPGALLGYVVSNGVLFRF